MMKQEEEERTIRAIWRSDGVVVTTQAEISAAMTTH